MMKTLLTILFLSQASYATPNSYDLLKTTCEKSPIIKIEPKSDIHQKPLCECVSNQFSQFVDTLNNPDIEISMMATAIKYYQGGFKKDDYEQDKHNTIGTLWNLTDKCIYLHRKK